MTFHSTPSRAFVGTTKIRAGKGAKSKSADGLTGIVVAREESRRTDDRRQDRLPARGERLHVEYRGRDHEIELVNLSAGGAMIATKLRPHLTERMDLRLGGGAVVETMVRWVKEGRVGLEFAHETQIRCSDDELARLLREVVESAFAPPPGAPAIAGLDGGDGPEERARKRHPLVWFGELLYGSYRWDVRLRNVSATGALLECPEALPVGSQVVLELGKAGSITASVAWVGPDHLGIGFHEPFDVQQLSQSKPQVAATKWLRPDYLENKLRDDSAWDEEWRRMSIDELRQDLEGFLKR